MEPTRVVVVSDSHLSSDAPDALANWDAATAYINAAPPDLVLHLGDLALDGADRTEDLFVGRAALDRLEVPWRAIPGNHDIGDNPSGSVPDEATVDTDRLNRWRRAIGDDYWSAEVGMWTLVAINAQLFGTGLDAEHVQWTWLEEVVARLPTSRQIALLTHKPLFAPAAERAAAPSYRFVPEDASRRIDEITDSRLRMVLSGHVHQYRFLESGERQHVWAPSTWAVLPDAVQPVFGTKTCGLLELSLPGHADAGHTLIEPPGLRQLTITRDVPDPYH